MQQIKAIVSKNKKIYNFIRSKSFFLKYYDKHLDKVYKKYTLKNLDRIKDLRLLFNDEDSKKTLDMIVKNRLEGVTKHNYDYDRGVQYFSIKEFSDQLINEVFVDAGSYDGDTLESFLKLTKGKFKEVHCIEPDSENLKKLESMVKHKKLNNVIIHPIGLWSHKDSLSFESDNTSNSKLTKNANSMINVDSIDNLFKDKKITFIKMDIEGAELSAIKGSIETIQKYKPKLAICLYHKPSDLLEIPLLIKDLNSDYKFDLRHYSSNYYETVLLAY